MKTFTQEGLEESIRFQMQTWNNEKVDIINSTKLNAVLSDVDGFDPSVASAKQFPLAIMWIVWANGGNQFEMPTNWIDMTVTELAEYIMQKQNNEKDFIPDGFL